MFNLNVFDNLISEFIKTMNVPALAVNCVVDQKTALSQTYGKLDIEKNILATNDDYFYISSCTKAFTALLVLIAKEEGKVKLDEPICQQIGEYNLFENEVTNKLVTLKDMCAHLTGLPRHDFMPYSCETREELAKRVRFLHPSEQYKNVFQYQNQVYTLIGYILEKIYGISWEQLVLDKIAKPLKLSIRFRGITPLDEKLAMPYNTSFQGAKRETLNEMKIDNPAGGIIMTNYDMNRWLRFLINCGELDGERIVSEKSFEEYITPLVINKLKNEQGDLFDGYAMGWTSCVSNGAIMVSHGGVNTGFQSLVCFFPKLKCGITCMTNQLPMPIHNMALKVFKDMIFDCMIDDYPAYFTKLYMPKNEEKNAIQSPSRADIYFDSDKAIGEYFDKGYGRVQVLKKENALYLEYYGKEYPLSKISGSHYSATLELGMTAKINFLTDFNMDVNKMEMVVFAGTCAKVEFIKIK